MTKKETTNIHYLQQLEIFKGIDFEVVKKLADIMVVRKFPVHATIAFSDDVPERVYLPLSGDMVVYQVTETETTIKKVAADLLEPGYFSNATLISSTELPLPEAWGEGMYDSLFIECRGDCIVGMIKRSDFFLLLRTYPDFGVRIVEQLSQRLGEAEARINDLAVHEVRTRIVRELARLGQRSGYYDGDWLVIDKKMSHEDLASLIGATREAVTRSLHYLKQEGRVKNFRQTYQVNMQELLPSFRVQSERVPG